MTADATAGTDRGTGARETGGGAADDVRAAVEAVLMVADAPVTVDRLAACLGRSGDEVRTLLDELAADYAGEAGSRARGFALVEAGGGWRIRSRPEYADVVGRFVTDGQTARLTQAALETLAVIAYRQPVSRSRVAAVRGVNVDGVVRTLVTRGLVRETGTDPQTGALLYGTTVEFLERLGLHDLDELPRIAPLLPDALAVTDLDEVRAAAAGRRTPTTGGPGRATDHDHDEDAGPAPHPGHQD